MLALRHLQLKTVWLRLMKVLHVRFPLCQESLSSQLTEKEQTMETWRKERDTLVAALEVQLQKLLSSQAEKDKLILQLRQNNTQPPQEVSVTQR